MHNRLSATLDCLDLLVLLQYKYGTVKIRPTKDRDCLIFNHRNGPHESDFIRKAFLPFYLTW